MTANECEWELEGFCNPPKEYKDFVCPSSVLKDGLRACHGDNNELMTEEEWEERYVHVERTVRDDHEMKGHQGNDKTQTRGSLLFRAEILFREQQEKAQDRKGGIARDCVYDDS